MAISNYGELKTAITAWLVRTDLASVIPDFIALAESDIRSDVRVRAMEALETGTLTGETLAHPTRFISARRLVVSGKRYEYRTPEAYQDADAGNANFRIFTSIGESLYILNGADGDAYSLIYRAGFAPLSADADTNWILTNAPDVMLFGACRHAAVYLRDDQEMGKYEGLYAAAVARLNDREAKAAVSGSPLQMLAAVAE